MAGTAKSSGAARTPALEWAASTLGAFFALAMLGYLAWDTIAAGKPPDMTVEAGNVHSASGGHAMDIKIINRGGATAAEVEVEGALTGPDGSIEEATVTFDFVPGASEREGTLVFNTRPEPGNIDLRIVGYRLP
jgi:uncharacterized protein (TIGR02588 family)